MRVAQINAKESFDLPIMETVSKLGQATVVVGGIEKVIKSQEELDKAVKEYAKQLGVTLEEARNAIMQKIDSWLPSNSAKFQGLSKESASAQAAASVSSNIIERINKQVDDNLKMSGWTQADIDKAKQGRQGEPGYEQAKAEYDKQMKEAIRLEEEKQKMIESQKNKVISGGQPRS